MVFIMNFKKVSTILLILTIALVSLSCVSAGLFDFLSGDTTDTDDTYGVRPVVSLTPGTEYTSGNGSMSDPYVVEYDAGTTSVESL